MAPSIVTTFGVSRDQAAMHIAKVMGGVHPHVRTRRCAPFSYLGNGWTDCVETWYLVRVPLARRFTKSSVGYSSACAVAPLFRVTVTAGRIALKFDLRLGDH